MSDEPQPGTLDRLVEAAARRLDALGLNGTRLRWRWNRRRRDLAERAMDVSMTARSARAKHKMCRSCRALVPRSERRCPECGVDLGDVATPGVGRAVTNALPGLRNATMLIMVVNGFWFALTLMAMTRDGGGGLFSHFDGRLLLDFGSGANWLVLHGGEWWRLVTPIFLHGGLIHFGFNSYVLMQLGPFVEEEFGLERFWTSYLLAGIGGNVASQLLRYVMMGALGRPETSQYVNTVGASGAIFGMVGLLLVYGWRIGGPRGAALRANLTRWIFFVVVLTVLVGGGIDHLNHAGGFATGAALGLVIRARRAGERTPPGWSVASLAGVLLVLYSFFRVASAAN